MKSHIHHKALAFLLVLLCIPALVRAQAGRDWGVDGRDYADPVTGLRIRELTSTNVVADNLYFHVSNFTSDNQHVIFTSTRTGSSQIYRAEVATGRIVQLTDEPGVSASSACPDPLNARQIYYTQRNQVRALDILACTNRLVGTVPDPIAGGLPQPTPDRTGQWLALSKQRDATNWEIGLMDTRTGAYRTVLIQGFRIGHVQHSPVDPLIFYVWETGGFAPQRTWLVNQDGTGNRPFYAITQSTNWFTPLKEWITHEAWVAGTGDMTMINDKVGVMVVKPNGAARLVREGRYWHAAATPDGRRLVIDDFDGNLWLCETATGEVQLLATGLRSRVKIHSHASFDRTPAGRWVQFHTGRTHETVAILDLKQEGLRRGLGSNSP